MGYVTSVVTVGTLERMVGCAERFFRSTECKTPMHKAVDVYDHTYWYRIFDVAESGNGSWLPNKHIHDEFKALNRVHNVYAQNAKS